MAEELRLRFTILGCGSSPGVPRINGDWGACNPDNPKNRRTRCSLLVERIGPDGVTSAVVDTTPDFRQQMLAAKARRLDGVLYTHAHADHIHGIDDLRQYALIQRHRMQVYGEAETLDKIMGAFAYCFISPEGSMYPPVAEAHEIRAGEIVRIEGPGGVIEALPFLQVHGPAHSLGYRFGRFDGNRPRAGGFAYSPDVSDLGAASEGLLQDLDAWVVDALQYRDHISHFSLAQALDWIGRLKPKHGILTHMHTPLDYDTVMAETPDHVVPAHDGQVLELCLPCLQETELNQ